MRPAFLAVLLSCLATLPAHAEKGDTAIKTLIEAEYSLLSTEPGKNARLKGDVLITRGSLRAQGDAGEYSSDPAGYRRFALSADAGKLVRFRQKLDGPGERWIEGEARRFLYDEKGNNSRLVGAARLRQIENGVTVQSVEGESILYDSALSQFAVANTESGESKAGRGRGRWELNQ